MGFVLLALLSGLSLLAALSVAARARFDGRAELALASSLFWALLVSVPIYGLGLKNVLTARTLAPTSAALFVLVIAACTWRLGVGQLARDVWTATKQLAWLPVDAIVSAIRARSFVAVGVIVTALFLSWVTVSAYFVPSWHGWDALWYHEPIVGFTLQYHGFGPFDVPLEKINGYPRFCEMQDLWFVIFTDRRLIDLASCLMAPSLVLGTYVMARRFVDSVTAVGLSCALIMTPMCTNTIQCAYVDVQAAALLVGAIAFATRPVLRLRDALIAASGIGMAIAAKPHALLVMPFLILIVVLRLILAHRKRPGSLVLTILVGASIIGAFGAATYVRNLVLFHNPLWPDFKYDNPSLGIHWPGTYEWGEKVDAASAQNQIDMNEPAKDLVPDVLSAPYSWSRWHYGEVHEYGFFVWWLVVPLASIAYVAILFAHVRSFIGLLFRRVAWVASPETRNAAMLALLVALMFKYSPALWAARYQIPMVAVALALIAWMGRSWPRLAQEAATFAIVAALATQWWSPRLWLWPSELAVLVKKPFPERELVIAKDLGPDVDIRMGSPVVTATGLAREAELGPGKVLVYGDDYGAFTTLFWNNHYDNRIVWVRSGPDWLARAEAEDATWIYTGYGDANNHAVSSSPNWEQVGILYVENWGVVYRRKR